VRTIYLDCNMGAAGDMLTAALLELHPDPDDFLRRFNSLGIPGVWAVAEPSVKCGIMGTHVRVTVNGEEETSADVGHSGHEHDHNHEHAHDHHQEHDHEHDHDHGHDRDHQHEHIHGHGHHHHHGHGHDHHHDHDHPHPPARGNGRG